MSRKLAAGQGRHQLQLHMAVYNALPPRKLVIKVVHPHDAADAVLRLMDKALGFAVLFFLCGSKILESEEINKKIVSSVSGYFGALGNGTGLQSCDNPQAEEQTRFRPPCQYVRTQKNSPRALTAQSILGSPTHFRLTEPPVLQGAHRSCLK